MSTKDNQTVCDYNEFRRPWYFHGMLLDDKDFLAEQAYHANKRRLLNRTLHGSGVVCGMGLKLKCGRAIEVSPGLALDCCGNEIYVDKVVTLDWDKLLPKESAKSEPTCQGKPANEDDKPKSYYLAIRYEEKESDLESVYLPRTGCEERTCEHSRYQEGVGFRLIEVVEDKVENCSAQSLRAILQKPSEWGETCREKVEEFCNQTVPCPECSTNCCGHCWVILGRIDINESGCIKQICINDCREYVITGPMLKYLIIRTMSGLEKNIVATTKTDSVEEAKECLPAFESLAANPVQAFCWFLRKLVVGKGRVDWKPVVNVPESNQTESQTKQPCLTSEDQQQKSRRKRAN